MPTESNNTYYNLITGKKFPAPTANHVFDFSFSPVNLMGKLYEPFIDKRWLKSGGEKPKWPNDAPFAVCLTHDVDVISAYAWESNFRRIKHILTTWSQQNLKQNLILMVEALESSIRGSLTRNHDPFHHFEDWLRVEREVGGHSTFFFTPESTIRSHFTDCWYKYSDSLHFESSKITVRHLIRELDSRGWEIGLHPSWHASTDVEIMKNQKEQVESVLGHPLVSVRQHWLNFDNFRTPGVQSGAGFKYDSSIGFNDNIGFRRGTSYPFRMIDINADQPLPLFEIPLIIQDGAMFHHRKGLRLDKDMGLQYIRNLAEQVQCTGGVLNLLWHPNTINLPCYWDAYRATLKLLQDMGAWFGSIREIGDWWHEKVGIDLLEFTRSH